MTDRAIVEAVKQNFGEALFATLGRFPAVATRNDHYMALALRGARPAAAPLGGDERGLLHEGQPHRLLPLGRVPARARTWATTCSTSASRTRRAQAMARARARPRRRCSTQEEEPGLGNGGLGRLAACYLDSLATLEIPAIGYGIRYEFGIFDQDIRDGWQVEMTDNWLRLGNPWEIAAARDAPSTSSFGGHTERYDRRRRAATACAGCPTAWCRASPTTRPILGYGVQHREPAAAVEGRGARSRSTSQAFNAGDYYGAVDEKVVLREHHQGALPERRAGCRASNCACEQQYFFVSCSLQDMIRIYLQRAEGRSTSFHEKFAVQLNDTHPAIAVAELMRLLVDEHGMDWERAWEITRQTFAYTNHTLLPEALENWPLALFAAPAAAAPRDHLRDQPRASSTRCACASRATTARLARLSLIDETRRALRAHGAPGLRRQPRHQRRGRAAHASCSSTTCCATSTSCGRRSSATRPTASRRGASSRWPTRAWPR